MGKSLAVGRAALLGQHIGKSLVLLPLGLLGPCWRVWSVLCAHSAWGKQSGAVGELHAPLMLGSSAACRSHPNSGI